MRFQLLQIKQLHQTPIQGHGRSTTERVVDKGLYIKPLILKF